MNQMETLEQTIQSSNSKEELEQLKKDLLNGNYDDLENVAYDNKVDSFDDLAATVFEEDEKKDSDDNKNDGPFMEITEESNYKREEGIHL